MGLLSSSFERRANPTVGTTGDPALLFNGLGGGGSNSGQNVNANSALTVSTVFACVNRISKTLAMLPLNVMRRLPNGGKEVATDHRLYKQLNAEPNRWQSSYDWRMMMQGHVLLRGNAYSLIVYYPGRGVNELVPMDPDRVWPFIVNTNGSIYYMNDSSPCPPAGAKLYYQYFPLNGETVVLSADEVLHIRGYSTNGIVGKNVIKLMRESIGLAMATEEQGARLFSNGAQIGKVFTHPQKMNDATYKRLKEELDKNTTGVGNAHKTLILEDGMSIAKTSLTMEEAEFLETRKFQVEDIASFMDVPLLLINRSGDKNQTFASAEQIVSLFVTHQMMPHFVCWEQVLNKDLLYTSEQKTYYIDFDFSVMLRGDSKARAEYLKARFNMGSMSPDQICMHEGESPTGTEEGKKFYLGSGTMPIDMAGKIGKPVNPIEPDSTKTNDKTGD